MVARKSAIFAFQLVKLTLKNIAHLIQYTGLEIQFWSVKCTIATVRYAKISSISIPSHQVMQAITIIRLAIWKKPLQNAFKRT